MKLTTFDPNRLVEYASVQSGLPDARHERHFGGDGESFDYRLVVEYEPRGGLRGLYDRLLVRRGIDARCDRPSGISRECWNPPVVVATAYAVAPDRNSAVPAEDVLQRTGLGPLPNQGVSSLRKENT